MAVHANVLRSFVERGKPVVTAREFAREANISVAEAEEAMRIVVIQDPENVAVTFIVNSHVTTPGGSTVYHAKRFTSLLDAQQYASEGAGRTLSLHSVTWTAAARPLTVCELLERKKDSFIQIAEAAAAAAAIRASYPLLSRQATIEKATSSGDLAPQSPLAPEKSKVSVKSPAAASETQQKTNTDLVTVAPEATNPAQACASTAIVNDETRQTVPPSCDDAGAKAPPKPSVPQDAVSQPVAHAAKAPPVRAQRTLFEMMKGAPAKRPRNDEEEVCATTSEKTAKPLEPVKPKNATEKSKSKTQTTKTKEETRSLVKLAKASSKTAHATVPSSSSALFDNEDADSDAEREEHEEKMFMQQAAVTDAPAAGAPEDAKQTAKRRGKVTRQQQEALNTIPCEDDDAFLNEQSEAASVTCGADDCELGDGALITRDGGVATSVARADVLSKPPVSPVPLRRPPVVVAQKRPREEAPVAIVGNMNAFLNPDLIAFQKQYVKEHRTVETVVNGEYLYNDELFYRHIESGGEVSVSQYTAMQQQVVKKFEETKQLPRDVPPASTEGVAPSAQQQQQQPVIKPAQPKAPSNPPTKTLLSYFQKKL